MPPRLPGHMAGVQDNIVPFLQRLASHGFEHIPYLRFIFGTSETASQPLPYLIRAYNREVPAKFPCKGGFASMGRPTKDNKHGPFAGNRPPLAVLRGRPPVARGRLFDATTFRSGQVR